MNLPRWSGPSCISYLGKMSPFETIPTKMKLLSWFNMVCICVIKNSLYSSYEFLSQSLLEGKMLRNSIKSLRPRLSTQET